MNIGFLLLFLLIQVGVNSVLKFLLAGLLTNIYGILAYYILSSLLIAFFGALLATPAGYRKDFLRQPGFHKMMLIYFVVFLALDLIFMVF